MTTNDLRSFLVHRMKGSRSNPAPVNQEILDQVVPAYQLYDAAGKKVTAYQVGETVIFISDGGLTKPRQILFVDSVSEESFFQEIE